MRRLAIFVLAAVTCSCGTGGPSTTEELANRCEKPRSGVDPGTRKPYPDRQGSALDEKKWLRAWSDDLYLWYRELPPTKPEEFQGTVLQYFDHLKTSKKTASGADKDKFHFTFGTAEWEQLSQSGVEAGYGATWVLVERFPPNRKAYVGYTEPGSPATTAGIKRGDEVVAVDGVAVADGSAIAINAGLFPDTVGEPHTFTLIDRGTTNQHDVTLTSAAIASTPVQHVGLLPNTTVGYMLFNSHIQTAEQQLMKAIEDLKNAGATDLVLDLRYNGGGYVFIASQLAYMIAGPSATAGKTFEKTTFNDKYPNRDPVTGEALTPVPFLSTGILNVPQTTTLPSLGLSRIYVLIGANTCSASESVINGLLGVDVQVNLFGNKTCGKPYGFYPQDNCGTTYFSIEFQGVNAKGFGDYSDGFVPGAGGQAGPPGCTVADDFTHELGDPAEARLAAALAFRETGKCPGVVARSALQLEGAGADVVLVRNPLLENRIYLGPR